jgi:hypothetical protein
MCILSRLLVGLSGRPVSGGLAPGDPGVGVAGQTVACTGG